MKAKIKLRNVLRRRLLLSGIILLFGGMSLLFFIFFGESKKLNAAAANGDIRSIASGDWTNLSIWQKYNGSAWIAASTIPSNGDKTITIQSGTTVTVSSALTVDQVVIEAGGVLELNSGVTILLKKSVVPDMQVYGIFRNAGTVTITNGTSITYYDGGKYQHNYTNTAGTIATGVWNPGSICEITGYTTNTGLPSGLNQAFDKFVWNCTSQSNNINLGGGVTAFSGDFILESTNSSELQFANNNYTFNMTGNFTINGGILTCNNAASKNINFNLTGNMYINGGTFNYTTGNSCTGNIIITGNYNQTGGTFNFGQGTSSNCNLNVSGNFTHSGGTITTSGSGTTGQIVFNNSGTQTFTASGNTVSGNVDYTISNGCTLNMGTSAMLGRNFTLSSGGEIGIGSPNGITSGSSGNIQVTGTRTYNSNGYFLFNGTSTQVTGNAFPASVYKLSVNNPNHLTLSGNVTVTNLVNFISGKILTGSNELNVTNTSAGAFSGVSTTAYVVGNLRRTISSSGNFDYPVGSAFYYEPMNITTTGVNGCTSIVGSFVNAVTNDTTYPLTVKINGVEMTEMFDHGYWALSPNTSLTGGTYTIQVSERGFTNMINKSTYYSLLGRASSTSSWLSAGIHNDNTQSESGGVVTAARSGLTSFYQFGIALGDFPSLSNPTLISGTAGAVGATYKFPDAMRGIDLWAKITNLYNGATLSDVDNSASGYNESFQPFVNFPPNRDSYIEWELRFKIKGTSTDTTMKKIYATGVDVDGGYTDASNNIREYIVATMPTSYSLDTATLLTMSNDSGRYKALSPTSTVNNIDTAHHEIMYQLNYNNVNVLLYRTGAVNNYSSTQTRQTSLYFRSFLTGSPVYALPIKLVTFTAKLKEKQVVLNWLTASETNNDYFTIERSSDGVNFTALFTKRGAGNSTSNKYYEMTDYTPLEGQSYYRLKQTDFDGNYTYSKSQTVNNKSAATDDKLSFDNLYPVPFDDQIEIEYTLKEKGKVSISLLNSEGRVIESKSLKAEKGSNRIKFEGKEDLKAGIYFVIVDADGQRITRKIIKN